MISHIRFNISSSVSSSGNMSLSISRSLLYAVSIEIPLFLRKFILLLIVSLSYPTFSRSLLIVRFLVASVVVMFILVVRKNLLASFISSIPTSTSSRIVLSVFAFTSSYAPLTISLISSPLLKRFASSSIFALASELLENLVMISSSLADILPSILAYSSLIALSEVLPESSPIKFLTVLSTFLLFNCLMNLSSSPKMYLPIISQTTSSSMASASSPIYDFFTSETISSYSPFFLA